MVTPSPSLVVLKLSRGEGNGYPSPLFACCKGRGSKGE
jgi:hypothetical protein